MDTIFSGTLHNGYVITIPVGKCDFSGVRERICVRQELGKTRAGARENTENDDITEDAQNYGIYRIYGSKFSPNITMTGVIRVSR